MTNLTLMTEVELPTGNKTVKVMTGEWDYVTVSVIDSEGNGDTTSIDDAELRNVEMLSDLFELETVKVFRAIIDLLDKIASIKK